MAQPPLPQHAIARHVGAKMEFIMVHALRRWADGKPSEDEDAKKALDMADALENDTFLYESAEAPV